MFQKILIANRGEIAVRIARTCREMGIEEVFVFSDVDADLPYIKSSNEAHRIGGVQAKDSYLDADAILAVAREAGCQAIHPGYGFLSENAIFAQRCMDAKLAWIGPSPAHIRQMGDKDTARRTMKQLGVPVIPGSDLLLDAEDARVQADVIGYPVLLKARSGGGGKGMRLVTNPQQLGKAFDEAAQEARSAFGDGMLYLEKYFTNARHVEFQICGDRYGSVIHFGERECSIQRKHQKLCEESPAHGLSSQKREALGKVICEALSKIGYENAGTMEFLLDSQGEFYFMEMNTRLQVEHPVTEMVTDIDLVQAQIRLACGERIESAVPGFKLAGHAMEFRINAEDPQNNFRPSPGLLLGMKENLGEDEGVRWDTFCAPGVSISPFYDSMIAKLIVKADDREGCMQKAKRVLKGLNIEGVATTVPFHLALLDDPAFRSGIYTTATEIEV